MRRFWFQSLAFVPLLGCAVIFAAETPRPSTVSADLNIAHVQPAANPTTAVPHPATAPANKTAVNVPPSSPAAPVAPVAPAAVLPPVEPAPEDPLHVPAAGRVLAAGEMLIVEPGENLTVESPAAPARALPVIDAASGEVAWVQLPARPRQLVAIRWLDTSNIKKLVEIEMLQGDLFLAIAPRGQPDRSLALRGRKRGLVVATPAGWQGLAHRSLKVHCEVDASLRLVGYGDPLLPGTDDTALTLGLHIFASLRPGALVQNAGATTLVVEQYDQAAAAADRLRFSDAPARVLLPPETSLTTNGGQFDLRHFYIPEPGQPAGPDRTRHVHADMPAVARAAAQVGGDADQPDGAGRAAEAPAGVLP